MPASAMATARKMARPLFRVSCHSNSGIYIAAYYLGGSLGSWLAVEIYRHLGWLAFLAAVALVLVMAGYGLRGMLRREAMPASP